LTDGLLAGAWLAGRVGHFGHLLCELTLIDKGLLPSATCRPTGLLASGNRSHDSFSYFRIALKERTLGNKAAVAPCLLFYQRQLYGVESLTKTFTGKGNTMTNVQASSDQKPGTPSSPASPQQNQGNPKPAEQKPNEQQK
jgi:hypothetical protein